MHAMHQEQTGATMAMQLFRKTSVCLTLTEMSFSAGARSPKAVREYSAFNLADTVQLAEAIRDLSPISQALWRLTNAHIPTKEVEPTQDVKSLSHQNPRTHFLPRAIPCTHEVSRDSDSFSPVAQHAAQGQVPRAHSHPVRPHGLGA